MSFSGGKKNKKAEKMLVSLSYPELVQKLLEDAASMQGSSKSAIVENCIFNTLLGKNKTTNMYIVEDLYGENGSLQNALSAIFSFTYAGLNGARYTNLKPLVEFVQRLFFQKCENMTLDYPGYEYIDKYIEYLIDDFNYDLENQNGNLRDLKNAISMLEVIRKDLANRYTQCNGTLFELINLLLTYWDIVKNWRSTYGLLQLISEKAPWETTPERRYKLRKLIVDVCDEWSEV